MIGLILAVVLSAQNPILLQVRPTIAMTRTDVNIQVRVWPDKGNRILSVGLYDRSGEIELTQKEIPGDSAPVLTVINWVDVGPGDYAVKAWVTRLVDGIPKNIFAPQAHLLVMDVDNSLDPPPESIARGNVPAQYDAIKASLVKQGVGHSTSDPAVKTRASKIFVAKGSGGSRSSRARMLSADRKPSRSKGR